MNTNNIKLNNLNIDNSGKLKIMSLMTLLKQLLKPFHFYLALLVSCSLVQTILLGFREMTLKFALDQLAIPAGFSAAIFWITMLVTSDACTEFTYRIYDKANNKYKPLIKKHITQSLIAKMLRYSYAFYQSKNPTELSTSISNIFEGIEYSSVLIFDEFIHFALLVCVSSLYALSVSTLFALIMFSWGVLWCVAAIFFGGRMYVLTYDYMQAKMRLEGNVSDLLSHIFTIFSFDNKEHEYKQVDKWTDDVVVTERKLRHMQFKVWVTQGICFVLIQSVLMSYILYLFKHGQATVGDVSLVFGLTTNLYIHLWDLAKNVRELIDSMGRIAQGLQTLNSDEDTDLIESTESTIVNNKEISSSKDSENKEAESLKITKGEIVFSDVAFRYRNSILEDSEEWLFDGSLSFTIEPGSVVGLVGPSGSGKSTIVKLLLRMFDIANGRILIDNQNIQEVTLSSLRQNIAIIPQDAGLFIYRSIIDNICYGTYDEITDNVRQKVIEAAKKAQAHEFIMHLPNQYNTVLGHQGINLSGGQKQRIAIARGLIRNASIFLLDEATSALDNITQSSIQDDIKELTKGKTVIIIAHRLDTLRHADKVLVFDKGKLVQQGKHSELITEQGLYRKMWTAQD